jgi:SSS family solute:Na+ symporter
MNLLTISDYYRERYGRGIEVACSLIIILSYLGWVAAQITALGLVFNGCRQRRHVPLGMVIGTLVSCWRTRCSAACGRWPGPTSSR